LVLLGYFFSYKYALLDQLFPDNESPQSASTMPPVPNAVS
jgi:hypothetical protein